MPTPSPFTISVDLLVENMAVNIEQFRRVTDGDNELIARRLFAVGELPEAAQKMCLLYGLSKKLQDSTSAESKSEGRLGSMDEVWERLKAEQWEKPREGGGPTVSAEVEALAKIKNVEVAVIQKTLRDLPAETRDLILNNERVVAMAADIKAAREAASVVDLSDLTEAAPEADPVPEAEASE